MKLSTGELCQTALFTALTVIGAQIAVPMPGGVPFTMQTWVIALAGMVLGPRNGALSAVVYVLLGAVGAPVFAHFSGGMGIMLGGSGGFIMAFPLLALLSGLGQGMSEREGGKLWLVSGLIAGTVLHFAAGMLYLSWVAGITLQAAFIAAVLPFIPSALLRIALLPFISKGLRLAISRARMGR